MHLNSSSWLAWTETKKILLCWWLFCIFLEPSPPCQLDHYLLSLVVCQKWVKLHLFLIMMMSCKWVAVLFTLICDISIESDNLVLIIIWKTWLSGCFLSKWQSIFLLDCSQSPIFLWWDRLDILCLTVTGILIFKCTEGAGVGEYSSGEGVGGEKNRGTVITSLQLAFRECVVPAMQAFDWTLDNRF